MFYGLLVYMYFFDNKEHHIPHIHVEYQDDQSVFAIETGDLITGKISEKNKKLIMAWIELHRDELMADWKLAISGQELFKIEPLK
jgi:desulfoferrodoxin (superoxide reductase-like protein)